MMAPSWKALALLVLVTACRAMPEPKASMAASPSAHGGDCPPEFNLELRGEVDAAQEGIVEIVDEAGHRTEWARADVCPSPHGLRVRGPAQSGAVPGGEPSAGLGYAPGTSPPPIGLGNQHPECEGATACAGLVLICCGERPTRAVGTCFDLTECPDSDQGEQHEMAAPPD